MDEPILSIAGLSKIYVGGLEALKAINLDIPKGEIFALLGPNGAGKTTMISIICGIVNLSKGKIRVAGLDILKDYRAARKLIGLVPQEIATDTFESVWATVTYSRGLFGKPKNPQYIEELLKKLSLLDKKDSKIMTLSGGMKRRVMIAKALSHEPEILFLDEPTAGVDVELRKHMWQIVKDLREAGVTIILTTHYIHEAEEIADRIGVINHGELIVVEEKNKLMKKLGKKELIFQLKAPLTHIPESLSQYDLNLSADNMTLTFNYDSHKEDNRLEILIEALKSNGINWNDLNTKESSLEEIFLQLVRKS